MVLNRAVATLVGACSVTGAVIWFVHAQQKWEKERMRQGVVRDIVREKQRVLAKAQESD